MEYQDKTLTCVECGESFVFSAGEQLFYASKSFKNEPKRCKECKAKRNQGSSGRMRVETAATCAACGKETTVPFKPTQGRPVLCRECFLHQRQGTATA
ncbi:MAG: zinc-ribbon domain containing protein [Acidobacteriota bacterium]